jgi:uncharacterized membrane protein YesL
MASRPIRKNQFWETVETWSSPVMANMLWLLLSMLLITMPLGFVGLFATIFHWQETRRTEVFSIFWQTIRRVWLKAYALFFLDLLVLGFLFFNLLIFRRMGLHNPLGIMSSAALLFATLVFVAVNLPAWLLLASCDASLKRILGFSLRLVFVEPRWILLTVIGFITPFFVSLYMPAVILVFLTGAISAYIACKGIYRLIYKYIPREELQTLAFD